MVETGLGWKYSLSGSHIETSYVLAEFVEFYKLTLKMFRFMVWETMVTSYPDIMDSFCFILYNSSPFRFYS